MNLIKSAIKAFYIYSSKKFGPLLMPVMNSNRKHELSTSGDELDEK